jgi:hypothetical protein
MNHRKQNRLALLCRLREMHVEQARAEHVAAQIDLDEKREQADATQVRIAALDDWAAEQMGGGSALMPEVLRQAQLFRGVEKQALERQRAAEEESRQRAEAARGELAHKFEDLSVAERLSDRHRQFITHEQRRRSYVELDEAGAQKKNLEAKE